MKNIQVALKEPTSKTRIATKILIFAIIIANIFFILMDSSLEKSTKAPAKTTQIICDNIATNIDLSLSRPLAQLNEELITSRQQWLQNPSGGTSRMSATSIERKKSFFSALYSNPYIIQNESLEQSEIDAWNKLSKNCVEKIINITGIVTDISDIDNSTEQISYQTATITVLDKKFHLTNINRETLSEGQTVELNNVKMLDNEILMDANSVLASVIMSPRGKFTGNNLASGNKNILTILAYFRNQPIPSTPTIPNIRSTMFGPTNPNVAGYYLENSYDSTHINGVVHPEILQIDMDAPGAGNFMQCEQFTAAANVLHSLDSIYDYDQYTNIVFIAPFGTACQWSGLAGKVVFETSDDPSGLARLDIAAIQLSSSSTGVIAHELGHNFGMGHAAFSYCIPILGNNGNCLLRTYGDLYDVMGNSAIIPRHFNAYHKDLAGWLKPSNVIYITNSVDCPNNICSIEPIETKSLNPKVLKISRSQATLLYVEYRQPIGYDIGMNSAGSDVFSGVLLHVVQRPWVYDTALIDPTPPASAYTAALQVGQTFIEPVRGTQIKLISATPGANGLARIEVIPGTAVGSDADLIINYPYNEQTIYDIVNVNAETTNTNLWRVNFLLDGVIKYSDYTMPYTWAWDTIKVPDGEHTISVNSQSNNLMSTPFNASNSISVLVRNQLFVSMDNLNEGQIVSGDIYISPSVTPQRVIVNRVEYLLDNALLYSYNNLVPLNWDTRSTSDGAHSIEVRVYDNKGNSSSKSVNVYVANSPIIHITSPTNGETIYQTTLINTDVTAAENINKVDFYIDNEYKYSDFYYPYSWEWDTSEVLDGTHTIETRIYDDQGDSSSDSVTVTVANNPIVHIISPVDGQSLSGTTDILAEILSNNENSRDLVKIFVDDEYFNFCNPNLQRLCGWEWNTRTVSNGSHNITIIATSDDFLNRTGSSTVNVIVNNQ